MPVYRFYIFEKNAHVAAPPKIYDLPNNAAALEAARTINESAVEVWCHTKKIVRLEAHDQPSSDVAYGRARVPRSSGMNGVHL